MDVQCVFNQETKMNLFNKLPWCIRIMFDANGRFNPKDFPRKWRMYWQLNRNLKQVWVAGEKETELSENELKALLSKREWGEWTYDKE